MRITRTTAPRRVAATGQIPKEALQVLDVSLLVGFLTLADVPERFAGGDQAHDQVGGVGHDLVHHLGENRREWPGVQRRRARCLTTSTWTAARSRSVATLRSASGLKCFPLIGHPRPL
jgi:hypothetical protein